MRHLVARSFGNFLVAVGLLGIGAMGGCSPVNWTMRFGGVYLAKAVPCELTFATQDPSQLWNMSTHQLIGTLVAERFKGSWDEALKKAVQEKACPVGADVAAITVVTVNPFNGVQSATITVYRRPGDGATQTATAPVPIKNI